MDQTEDGYIYALDAATGEQLWKYDADGRVYSSPAVTGGSSTSARMTATFTRSMRPTAK